MKQWDVFLSHASEDKQTVALPLTESLRRAGVRVWLDKFQIEIGDSLRQKIDEGLANSRFGVVILSEAFLTKHWTGRELDALWALDVVLPVWHGINSKTLMKYSPLLAGKVGVSTTEGIDAVAHTITSRIFKFDNQPQQSFPRIAREFALLLAKINGTAVNEVVDFIADHPRILTRSLGVHIDSEDLFRVNVPLGSNVIHFCAACFQPTTRRMSDYQFVILGPVGLPLFDGSQPSPTLSVTLKRATEAANWLQSNVLAARDLLRDVPSRVLTKVVIGRRPQPDSLMVQMLQELNDDLNRIQVRTYDWLLDTALALAEESED